MLANELGVRAIRNRNRIVSSYVNVSNQRKHFFGVSVELGLYLHIFKFKIIELCLFMTHSINAEYRKLTVHIFELHNCVNHQN